MRTEVPIRSSSSPIVAVILVAWIVPPAFAQDAQLLGEWEIVGAIADGKPQVVKPHSEAIKIEDGRISFGVPGVEFDQPSPCIYTAREFDMDMSGPGSKRPDIWKGIYELKGNELRLAFAASPGAERPKDFDGSPDKPMKVLILKKVGK
jgi:uncharacterized protein (TIGR03067 family)